MNADQRQIDRGRFASLQCGLSFVLLLLSAVMPSVVFMTLALAVVADVVSSVATLVQNPAGNQPKSDLTIVFSLLGGALCGAVVITWLTNVAGPLPGLLAWAVISAVVRWAPDRVRVGNGEVIFWPYGPDQL